MVLRVEEREDEVHEPGGLAVNDGARESPIGLTTGPPDTPVAGPVLSNRPGAYESVMPPGAGYASPGVMITDGLSGEFLSQGQGQGRDSDVAWCDALIDPSVGVGVGGPCRRIPPRRVDWGDEI